jgi:hypothetical protein
MQDDEEEWQRLIAAKSREEQGHFRHALILSVVFGLAFVVLDLWWSACPYLTLWRCH